MHTDYLISMICFKYIRWRNWFYHCTNIYVLPSKTNELDSHINLETKPVGFIRRLIAMQIDWIFLSIVVPVIKTKEILSSFLICNLTPICMNSFSLRVQSLFTLLLFHTLRMEKQLGKHCFAFT